MRTIGIAVGRLMVASEIESGHGGRRSRRQRQRRRQRQLKEDSSGVGRRRRCRRCLLVRKRSEPRQHRMMMRRLTVQVITGARFITSSLDVVRYIVVIVEFIPILFFIIAFVIIVFFCRIAIGDLLVTEHDQSINMHDFRNTQIFQCLWLDHLTKLFTIISVSFDSKNLQ